MPSTSRCRADRLIAVHRRLRRMHRATLLAYVVPVTTHFTHEQMANGDPQRWMSRVRDANPKAEHGIDVEVVENIPEGVTVRATARVRPPQYAPPILS